ncbi:uncharacterized protein LOC114541706 [Dendronephthya gigantea]|uniref:uncharacterized protein LOC114541706 n=1 Tax=Dendronephthya gigantea TaxID=151771 RepID=UPI00106B5AFF|nr:uncharacterized protein LOC114541706 [Dendronephthya gigantea]
MSAEDIAKALGNPGKFQILLTIFLCLNYVYVGWNHLGMAFIGAKTKHHCSVKNSSNINSLVPLVKKNGKEQWDGCNLYSDHNSSKKVECSTGWTYYLPDKEQTIISEWDLVCDDAYKSSLATTIYFVGVMLGGLVFGTLSDRFGRRPILLFTMFTPALIGLLVFFIRDYVAFVVLRFVLGFLLQGLQMTSFLSFMEILAAKYRTTAGVASSIFWSFGVMSLALISYLIQDWRYIQLFCTVTGLLQIGLICVLPESFRWLLTKNRFEDAERIIEKITSFNDLPFPREEFDKVADNSNKFGVKKSVDEKNYSIIDIFRSSVLRKRSLILAFVWFSTSFGYYGLALNVSSLDGNKYLNFFISGIFELGIYLVTVFVLLKLGRRKPLCFYSVIGGVTCILAGALSKDTDFLKDFTTALALCGRICISGNFAIIFLYTSELYPTVIRNVGLGAGIFFARTGSILAPQVFLLGKYTTESVPFIIYGACVLFSGLLTLLMPETLNMKLAETMQEATTFEKATENSVELHVNKMNKDDDVFVINGTLPVPHKHEKIVSMSDEGAISSLRTTKATMTTDTLTNSLGKPGKFQVLMYIYLSASWVYISWNHLGMAFIGAKTKHRCAVTNSSDITSLVPLIKKRGVTQWDGCHLYDGYNTSKKISCPNGWFYDLPKGEMTIISEWDLVCDDAYKTSLATTIYFVGVMLGGLVFGTLSDRFGRRPVFLFTTVSTFVLGLPLFFIKNYVAFVVLRFFLGFVLQGVQMSTFTSLMELFATKYRTYIGVGIGFPWATGIMTLALFSYLIKDWHYIQLLSTTVCLLQVALVWFLPESIRWLLINNRTDQAKKVVEKISNFNKISFPKEIFEETVDEMKKAERNTFNVKSYNITDIYRSESLRKRSLIMMVVWFATSLGYYGLSLNISSLAGDKYLNFFINGVLEIVIITTTMFLLKRFGRRRPFCVYSILGGSGLIIAGALPKSNENVQILVTVLAIMCKMLVTGNFANIFTFTSELYPTMIRNVGLGAGIFWTRFGGILAPQILLLGTYTAESVPFIIMGGFMLTAGLLALLLPETLNTKLCETLQEMSAKSEIPQENNVLASENIEILSRKECQA